MAHQRDKGGTWCRRPTCSDTAATQHLHLLSQGGHRTFRPLAMSHATNGVLAGQETPSMVSGRELHDVAAQFPRQDSSSLDSAIENYSRSGSCHVDVAHEIGQEKIGSSASQRRAMSRDPAAQAAQKHCRCHSFRSFALPARRCAFFFLRLFILHEGDAPRILSGVKPVVPAS